MKRTFVARRLRDRTEGFHVWIAKEQIVRSNQCQLLDSRRRHQNTIGGVAVDCPRQIVSFPGDLVGERDRRGAELRKRELLPLHERVFQAQKAEMNQPRDFQR